MARHELQPESSNKDTTALGWASVVTDVDGGDMLECSESAIVSTLAMTLITSLLERSEHNHHAHIATQHNTHARTHTHTNHRIFLMSHYHGMLEHQPNSTMDNTSRQDSRRGAILMTHSFYCFLCHTCHAFCLFTGFSSFCYLPPIDRRSCSFPC